MYRKKYSKMIAAIMMAVMSVTPVMADDEAFHVQTGTSVTVYSQSNPSGYSSGSVYNSRENDRTDLTGSSVSHSGSPTVRSFKTGSSQNCQAGSVTAAP